MVWAPLHVDSRRLWKGQVMAQSRPGVSRCSSLPDLSRLATGRGKLDRDAVGVDSFSLSPSLSMLGGLSIIIKER